MVTRSQERNITDKAEEQGARERKGEEKAAVRHHSEAAVPQHCEELLVDELPEEHADISGQESLEGHVPGPTQRGFQGLDV